VLLFFLLVLNRNSAYSDAQIKRYFNDELKKMRFHLGFGIGIGSDFYLNYSEYNTFPANTFYIKWYQDIAPGKFGLAFASFFNNESDDMTDNELYYGMRRYRIINEMIGIHTKFKSFIPFTDYIAPYLLIGGGIVEGTYTSLVKVDRYLFTTDLNFSGYSLGLTAGTEVFIIPDLLTIDLGIKFNYNFNMDVSENFDYDYTYTVVEGFSEVILNLYCGVSYYVF